MRDGAKIMIKDAQNIIKKLSLLYNIPASEICKESRVTLTAAQNFVNREIKLYTAKTYIDSIECIKGFLQLDIFSAGNDELKDYEQKLKSILASLTKWQC